MNTRFILPIVGIALVAVAIASYLFLSVEPQRAACTQEAKLCPGGSYVGRAGPNCEFALCPPVALCEGGGCLQMGEEANGKSTAIDTSDWKTYRNEEYGFEVKYPVDWVIGQEEPDTGNGLLLTFGGFKTNNTVGLTIFKGSINDALRRVEPTPPIEIIEINGIPFRAVSHKDSGFQSNYELYMEHNGFVYYFWEGFSGQPGDKDIINTLPTTFKFTK